MSRIHKASVNTSIENQTYANYHGGPESETANTKWPLKVNVAFVLLDDMLSQAAKSMPWKLTTMIRA